MILAKPERKSFKGIAIAGIPDKRFDVEIRSGRFVSVREADAAAAAGAAAQAGAATQAGAAAQGEEAESAGSSDPAAEIVDGSELWITPGLIDLHTHMAWTDFDHADQDKRDPAEVEAMQARAFEATLRTGVTTVRDAGGLTPAAAAHLVREYRQPLRIDNGSHMFGAADARGADYLKRKADEVFASGANWIKIMATGGLGAPTESVTDPVFTEDEFAFLVRYAHENGRKVFVHAWGGAAIDWSARAGVQSIEHGMFLTADQAARLAEANVAFVPTASIYRIAADPQGVLGLPPVIRDRAARAVEAHANAVAYAKRAGVRIGFGTDYATPHLHGRNLQELYTLLDYGLNREEAWIAATSDAARILGRSGELGSIAEGYLSDAVIFGSDPYAARSEAELRGSIAAVITGTDESELA
ncbi:amidohydrolase family protein [Saccharibacillus sp. CPCC 101409]|uniref:amidohydrolase family protein n=1 Tax=Saccharibacillus sp. CPCC 101409 TaxID=3058041 RepID=UPI002672DFEA|nr:amidohydrolase family protein [Saccharibacillus sp. CPCC 101409]MDO3413028.1 amidohydrolase family protein [Saccharibacillus sp. CPCC 101409]